MVKMCIFWFENGAVLNYAQEDGLGKLRSGHLFILALCILDQAANSISHVL